MLQKKNYIITGATTELGFQVAKYLSRKNKLLLISRDEKKIIKVKKKLIH